MFRLSWGLGCSSGCLCSLVLLGYRIHLLGSLVLHLPKSSGKGETCFLRRMDMTKYLANLTDTQEPYFLRGLWIKGTAKKSVDWKWRWNLFLKNSHNIQGKSEGKANIFPVKNEGRYSWEPCGRDLLYRFDVVGIFFHKMKENLHLASNQTHLSCISSFPGLSKGWLSKETK